MTEVPESAAAVFEARMELIEEVRNLLPPVPEVAEEVGSGHESDVPR